MRHVDGSKTIDTNAKLRIFMDYYKTLYSFSDPSHEAVENFGGDDKYPQAEL